MAILAQGLKSTTIDVYHDFSELPSDARAAMGVAERLCIQQGFDWYSNLTNTVYQEDTGIRIVVHRDNDGVLAVLPLHISIKKNSASLESLANFYTSLYQPYFSDRMTVEKLISLFHCIISAYPELYRLRLAPLNVDYAGFNLLRSAASQIGLASFPFFCFGNWYLKVNFPWNDYLASRTGMLKNTLSRKRKKFEQSNGVLELIQTPQQQAYGVLAYQQVYANSWKIQEPFPEFMPGLVRMLADNGWLRMGLASVNGKPVAAQIWIVAYGKACIYKLAYDEAYKHLSAGSLLTAMLMEHVLDHDKVLEVDYLCGDDPYKAEWMSDRRERWGIVFFNLRTIRGVWAYTKEACWRLVKPFVARLRYVLAREGNQDV